MNLLYAYVINIFLNNFINYQILTIYFTLET